MTTINFAASAAAAGAPAELLPRREGFNITMPQRCGIILFRGGDLLFKEQSKRLCNGTVFKKGQRSKNIILCGFMGSGKTTVGGLLARRIGRRFVDMDQWIEQQEGYPIAQIFSRHGESRFRELEYEAVRALSREVGIVIAAGGGTVLDIGNTRALKSGGAVVLLDASLGAVQSRLRGDKTRPLLQREDRDAVMETLYWERLPVYRQRADVSVPADGSPERTAQLVLRALNPVRFHS